MKALVTGASGFIGKALCRELAFRGTDVTALVRPGKEEALRATVAGITVLGCDMAEYARLPEKTAQRDFDVLYHLAWNGAAGAGRADVSLQLWNIRCSCDLMTAAAGMGCRRVVFASSIMENELRSYEQKNLLPPPASVYPAAKAAAGLMCAAVAGAGGMELIRMEISNVYGPGEETPRLINSSLRKLLKGEPCPFSPGEHLYDFIYITDAAKGFAAAGERGISGKRYYLGSLSPRPLKVFLEEMCRCVDPALHPSLGVYPSPAAVPDYREIDVQALGRDTGFVPLVSFSEGIGRTIEAIRREEA